MPKTCARWRLDEDDIIRQLHPHLEDAEAHLPGRSLEAIKIRARRLGLVIRSRKKWTDDRVSVLRQLSSKISDSQAASILGTSTSSIGKKRREMGVLRPPAKRTKYARWPIVGDIQSEAERRGIALRSLGDGARKQFGSKGYLSYSAIQAMLTDLGGEAYAVGRLSRPWFHGTTSSALDRDVPNRPTCPVLLSSQ